MRARAIREGENFTQPEEAFHQAFVAATLTSVRGAAAAALSTMPSTKPGAALDVEALLAQPTLQDNEVAHAGFLQQRDEEGVRHTMAAHSGAPSTCWIKPASAAFEFYPR